MSIASDETEQNGQLRVSPNRSKQGRQPFTVCCGPEQERLGLPSPDGQLPPTEIVEPKVTHKETISKVMNIKTPFKLYYFPEASK